MAGLKKVKANFVKVGEDLYRLQTLTNAVEVSFVKSAIPTTVADEKRRGQTYVTAGNVGTLFQGVEIKSLRCEFTVRAQKGLN